MVFASFHLMIIDNVAFVLVNDDNALYFSLKFFVFLHTVGCPTYIRVFFNSSFIIS